MKKVLLILTSILILACQEKAIETKGPLEGVWKRVGNIIYKDGQPMDTTKFGNEQNQASMYKLYTKKHMIWLNNGINLDTVTNKDLYAGAAAFATNYSVEGDQLMEYVVFGTDNIKSWLDSQIPEGEDGFRFTATINISENHFSQGTIDSLGNGIFELWSRLE